MKYLDPRSLSSLSGLHVRVRYIVEGLLAGLHSSPYRGHSVEFAQHREYSFGDEPRHIDWKVFGRSDRFFVKQYQDETNLRAYLFLDASGSMRFASAGMVPKLEYAVHLVAALSFVLLHQEDAAGLGIFDTGVKTFIPPNHQLAHLARLMGHLETVKAGGDTSIGLVLKEFGRHIRRRSLVVLISDLFDEPQSIIRALRYYRSRHHEVMVLQVLDPEELRFSYSGESLFSPMEQGNAVFADAESIAAEYRALFGSFIEEYKNCFSASGIDYHLVTTDTPYEKALARCLAARG